MSTATSLLASAPIKVAGYLRAVEQHDDEFDSAIDDVLVGDHVPGLIQKEAAAGPRGHGLVRAILDLLVDHGHHRRRKTLHHFDRGHRRLDPRRRLSVPAARAAGAGW